MTGLPEGIQVIGPRTPTRGCAIHPLRESSMLAPDPQNDVAIQHAVRNRSNEKQQQAFILHIGSLLPGYAHCRRSRLK
ncbi:MAG: hypothetical protein QM777_15120 [Pseudorhodoferax sp.]